MARARSRDIRRARIDAERHRFDHLAPEPDNTYADDAQFDLEDWLSGPAHWDEPMPWTEAEHVQH